MFNRDFYPTPQNVIEQMIDPSEIRAKIFLEPSAGKGNIVDYLKRYEPKKVLACEIEEDLREILSSKCDLIGKDFLEIEKEDISHVDVIIMNPPFSTAEKHILHAWNIAPEGCQIISLCNYETIERRWNNREVYDILQTYGTLLSLGDCFRDAERTTSVEIGLLKLYKPVLSEEFDYEGYFLEEEVDVQFGHGNEIMTHDSIRLYVENYVRLIRAFSKLDELGEEVRLLMSALEIGTENPIKVEINYRKAVTTKEEFVIAVQKALWRKVFDKLKMGKYVTENVMCDLNRAIEKQVNIPFTVKNIYRMLDMIFQSRGQIMNKVIEESIDSITRYSHENRYNVEGWKTNSGYMLNKKFILSGAVELWFNNTIRARTSKLDDLIKAICYIRGYDAGVFRTLSEFLYLLDAIPGKWYEFGLFRVKGFKKGSLHVQFNNEQDWEAVNRAYAKIKGQALPEKI